MKKYAYLCALLNSMVMAAPEDEQTIRPGLYHGPTPDGVYFGEYKFTDIECPVPVGGQVVIFTISDKKVSMYGCWKQARDHVLIRWRRVTNSVSEYVEIDEITRLDSKWLRVTSSLPVDTLE